MLAEIYGRESANLRDIEVELAWALRSVRYSKRGTINWSVSFPWLKRRLCEAQNHRCCWCNEPMDEHGPLDQRPTFEHLVPLSAGGADTPRNLAIACHRCNTRRGSDEGPPHQP